MGDGTWRVLYMAPDEEAHFVAAGSSLCGLEGLWGMTLMSDDGDGHIERCRRCRAYFMGGDADGGHHD